MMVDGIDIRRGIFIENLTSKRYTPDYINLDNNNDSRSLTIRLVGHNKRVLEVGTSTGYVTKILREMGNSVIGLEIDEDASKIAAQYCTSMIVGDVESIDLGVYIEDSSLDVIIFGDVLEHLKSPAVVLESVKKYLKPGGYLVVSLPNGCHGDIILNLMFGDFRYTTMGLHDITHLRFFGFNNIVDLFNECGFSITDMNRVTISVGCTELKPDLTKVPKELFKFIELLPDSNVYQYVFRAVPNMSKCSKAMEASLNELFERSLEDKIKDHSLVLEEKIQLQNEEIQQQKEEIQQQDAHISLLTREIQEAMRQYQLLEQEYIGIKKSVLWRVLMFYQHGFVDRLMPANTKRRHAYDLILKGIRIFVTDGPIKMSIKVKQYLRHKITSYQQWIKENEPSIEEIASQKTFIDNFEYQPKISIITPIYNTPIPILKRTIESVLGQTYKNWELCLADGKSDNTQIRKLIQHYSRKDSRVKVKFLIENKGISGNTNEAIALATGEYIAFLDHDDELAPFALYEIVKKINETKPDIIYSDEDKIGQDGKRRDPFFKPYWSLPMFLSTNYLCHFFVCKKSLYDGIGGMRSEYDGAQDYDLILRLIEKTKKIEHIPKILYHWRITSSSSSSGNAAKPYAYEAGKKALRQYMLRNNIEGDVLIDEVSFGSYRVKKSVKRDASVIIIALQSQNSAMKLDKIIKISGQSKMYIAKKDAQNNPDISLVSTYIKFDKEELLNILSNDNPDYIIFVDMDEINDCIIRYNNEWINALIEQYEYFNAGVVGTGAPYFSNIICSVHRPCGPVFCISKKMILSYLEKNNISVNYDMLQISLSDYAESLGTENIYTPFSLVRVENLNKIRKYYSDEFLAKSTMDNTMYYVKV